MVIITAEVDERVEWWRPLVQWVMCVPHLAYNGLLSAVSIVAHIVAIPIVVATGRLPRPLAELHVLVLRERARTFAFLFLLRRSRPPFATARTAEDPGDDPMQTVSVTIADRVPRSAPITRLFTVAPHVLVLLPIGACLDLLYPLWMILVAVNRGWPPGMARTLASIERWVVSVILYGTMVTNEPPRFGLAVHRDAIAAT
jgi:hypothetical protein